jgi:hypothetical protein
VDNFLDVTAADALNCIGNGYRAAFITYDNKMDDYKMSLTLTISLKKILII